MEALKGSTLKNKVKEIYFKTKDGERLNGWFIPPSNNRSVILYVHGSGGNIGDRWAVMLPFVKKGYGFFMFDYRGYGKSTGNPTEQGLYTDVQAASNYLEVEKNIPRSEQVILGGSL
jgi:uncharacterized protein